MRNVTVIAAFAAAALAALAPTPAAAQSRAGARSPSSSRPRTAVRAQAPAPYPSRVEIRRTAFGVPHVRARDIGALGYGMAWAQLEDFGFTVVSYLIRGRGEMGRYFGHDQIETDFHFRQTHRFAVERFGQLQQQTRDLYAGWAAAVNRYVAIHADSFPAWTPRERTPRDFTAQDVAAAWVDEQVEPAVSSFLRHQGQRRAGEIGRRDTGSQAWAFAPSRTTSGRAILLRNPHLSWGPGWDNRYYEMQITVPGVVDFYGDFRIGFPMYFNGGFNAYLGWATTNNDAYLAEIYALDVDSTQPDHVRFDGASVALERIPVTVEYKSGDTLATETRVFWRTPIGPVVHRDATRIYVVKSAEWGETRKTEQFLRMMEARNLTEWKAALRMRAHVEQNLTYADRAGNIFYVWNAAIPRLPRPAGGDTVAVPAHSMADVWTELWPFDSLPQLLNPPGGYLQNANDPYHYTNLNAVMDSTRWPAYFPRPYLGLRSQHSLQLVTSRPKVSLEDVVRMKHDPAMLLADRVRSDLVAAVRATNPQGEVADAIALIEHWDGTVAAESRGGTLFEAWFRHYLAADTARGADRWARAFSHPWTPADPTGTPRGLADPARAVTAFAAAMAELKARFGRWDVAWGEVHRLRLGDVDVPAAGCSGDIGCFRVFGFTSAPDRKWVGARGDEWVLAVEFGARGPRAYSVLEYGESDDPASPHHTDQVAMFARGELKHVAFTEREIQAQLVRRYRPE
jgi:acyl-homoserine-lactone acylase